MATCVRYRHYLYQYVTQYVYQVLICGVEWTPEGNDDLQFYHYVWKDPDQPELERVTICCLQVDGYPTGYVCQRTPSGQYIYYKQYGFCWTFLNDPKGLYPSRWLYCYPFGILWHRGLAYFYWDIFERRRRRYLRR